MKPNTIREGRAERINETQGRSPWIKPALKPTLTLASTYVRPDFLGFGVFTEVVFIELR